MNNKQYRLLTFSHRTQIDSNKDYLLFEVFLAPIYSEGRVYLSICEGGFIDDGNSMSQIAAEMAMLVFDNLPVAFEKLEKLLQVFNCQ